MKELQPAEVRMLLITLYSVLLQGGGGDLTALWKKTKNKSAFLETDPFPSAMAALKLPHQNSSEGELQEFIASSHPVIVALNGK